MSAGSRELCLSLQFLVAPPCSQTTYTMSHMGSSFKSPQKQGQNPRFITPEPQPDHRQWHQLAKKCLCQEHALLLTRASQGFPARPRGTRSLAFAVLIICKENNSVCLRPAHSEISEVKCRYSAGVKLYLPSNPATCR